MESKKQEKDQQFVLWMTASILFHMILLLILLIIHFQEMFKNRFSQSAPRPTKDQDFVIPIQQVPEQKKEETPPPLNDPSVQYTLIPGRQAVLDETKEASDQTQEKKEDPIVQTEETTKTEDIPENTEEQKTEAQTTPIPDQVIQQEKSPVQVPAQPNIDITSLKKLLDQQKQEREKEEEQQKPKQDLDIVPMPQAQQQTNSSPNPTIKKKKVSLKDIKLGFSKFMQEGNNDILVQEGNTNQPPDAQSLKMITYSQQIARAMKEIIVLHEKYRKGLEKLRQHTKAVISISLARNGKLLNFKLVHGTGNTDLDAAIVEAIPSINLYPAVPAHITQDPLEMTWTLLF